MSILSIQEKDSLISQLTAYDYVRFNWADIHGISRGKTVPARYASNVIKNGIDEFPGTVMFGPRTQFTPMPSIFDSNTSTYSMSNFVPASPLYDLPWAGNNKYKIRQILCEAFWFDSSPVKQVPRTVARKQIERLQSMGYTMMSGFEAEFIVVDEKTLQPVTDGTDFITDVVFAKHSDWLLDAEKQLASAGINVGALHAEYSPGQFEFCMAPNYGIKTFDDMIIFKQALREILTKHDRKPTFMTHPFSCEGRSASSGFHFNHSLWNEDGKCVFYDVSKPNNMSDVMRYWLGGIMKHIKSLLLLCNPTPNCFRRIHGPFAPDKENWGIDNRLASIRVRNKNEGHCLIENRLPSSACNPYIVAAATIAAGLDGVEKKIDPPPEGVSHKCSTFPSFEECLNALQSDTELVSSLGEEFIEWWIAAKKEHEISKFGNLTMSRNPPEDELALERKEYFDFI